MRIISFTEYWVNLVLNVPKLETDQFSTWRFTRRDKDYFVGEKLQVWFRQRSPKRKFLFNAEVVSKTPRQLFDKNETLNISWAEAKVDGFESPEIMFHFLVKAHGEQRVKTEPINILFLRKIKE